MRVFTRRIILLQGREQVVMEWEAMREGYLLGTSSSVEVFTDLFWCGRGGVYHLNVPPGSDWVATVRNSCSPHHIHILRRRERKRKS